MTEKIRIFFLRFFLMSTPRGKPSKGMSSALVYLPTKRHLLAGFVFISLIVSFDFLCCLATVAYTYMWWGMRPKLLYSLPPPPLPKGTLPPVPRILHQTWKTKDIPLKWRAAQRSCQDMHKDYEYMLWTDDNSLKFIKEHYPWFTSTFISYPHPIQRADAIRYFILHKFGGIYIDLDVVCQKPLGTALQMHQFTAPATYPIGISNDILAAAPRAAFLDTAIKRLARWNRWLGPHYVQIMFSTGPMFLTVQYALYPHDAQRQQDVAVLPTGAYGKYNYTEDALFGHLHGSSWHEDDADVVMWLDGHKKAVAQGVVIVAGVAVCLYAWRCYQQRKRSGGSRLFDIESSRKILD